MMLQSRRLTPVISLKRLARAVRGGERGQMIFWMLLILPLFVIGAAIVIDTSVWYGHRRVYQKTADASALAGAQELFNRTTSADMEDRATEKATEWMLRNNRPPADFANDTPEVVKNCWGMPSFDGKPDGVIVDVSGEAPLLFMRAFKIAGFNIGGHAKVCLGTPQLSDSVLPMGIPMNSSPCFQGNPPSPRFGSQCPIAVRVPAGTSGQAQYIRLLQSPGEDPLAWSRDCSASNAKVSRADFVHQVSDGAHTWCAVAPPSATCPATGADVGYCAYPETGNKADWAMDGIQARLAYEGQTNAPYNCDYQYATNPNWRSYPSAAPGTSQDHVDQWWEALEPEAGAAWPAQPTKDVTFVKRDCVAPRLVTLILVDDFVTGNPPIPIRGFAGMFIEGCFEDLNDSSTFDAGEPFDGDCRTKKNGGPLSNNGHIFINGTILNYVDMGGPGGQATQYGRLQLYLVE